jgi:diguanylate cyclase (GGDEF)-like protein
MKASHYLRVAGTPRFRAVTRSGLRASFRQATLLVIAVAIADSVWLTPLFPDAALLILAVNGSIAGLAGAMFLIGKRLRHVPVEAMLFALLLAVDAGLSLLKSLEPDLALVSAGFALLLPIIVALVLPWRTLVHAAWVSVHAGLVIANALLSPTYVGISAGPAIMIGLIIGASVVSQMGHIINLRARVNAFVQVQNIAAMSRRLRNDEARLRELNRVLENAVQTDELTGLRNRLALQLYLQTVRARVSRSSATFALVMLDIDHFKGINDRFGHVEGDAVLRRVSAAIVAACRGEDLVFRFGGEEFIALAEVADAPSGHRVAERIRAQVENLRLPHQDNPPFGVVTLSAGVALITKSVLGEPETAWVERADAALYAAKSRGRNRVEDWSPAAARRGRPASHHGKEASRRGWAASVDASASRRPPSPAASRAVARRTSLPEMAARSAPPPPPTSRSAAARPT